MKGGWKPPPPPPQCYNETKKPSACRVKVAPFVFECVNGQSLIYFNDNLKKLLSVSKNTIRVRQSYNKGQLIVR